VLLAPSENQLRQRCCSCWFHHASQYRIARTGLTVPALKWASRLHSDCESRHWLGLPMHRVVCQTREAPARGQAKPRRVGNQDHLAPCSETSRYAGFHLASSIGMREIDV
jgi:hypothetical protein